ncbi:hypothetical protein AMJ52_06000 [candidate division TA06 bacterium DG_78]|uniref:FlgD Ig-like domain-containing protein n=1 Tax=candidate division TA06 bacterium DG_78 TaxID=1703772 RepID=A0A0S7YDR3_UNCT6|nr:MAG: hypothetical protein AMJ52_06000 [candidate division TA06 bacterium DG_78]
MNGSILLCLAVSLFNQNPLLLESFTNEQFPPAGWDTLRSDTIMTHWYRYNYTGPSGPDSFQARVRVYDALDTLRSGWTALMTLPINLVSAEGQESLFFWYRFSQESDNLGPNDTLYIDISNDEIDWHNLLKIGPGDDTDIWNTARINLSPYNTFDNGRIRFHYHDMPNSMLGTWNCNFWLDSVKVMTEGEVPVTPIAEAFRDLDSNYVPDLLGSVVIITGVVTAPPGIFYDLEAYIQDSSGGVDLFGNFPVELDYGDSIITTGTVDQYRGKNELTNFDYSLIEHDATIPEPIEIDGIILNTEYYEGSLVKIKVAYMDAFIFEGNQMYDAWDTSGTKFTIWIDSYTNIAGNLAPSDTFTLTGIKGQYTYSTPPNDGYQLMPRDTFDFSHLFIMPPVKDIAEVQTPGPDGVTSQYYDSIVVVEGVITGPNYVFSTGTPSFYIQDCTGGINIYGADGEESFNNHIDSLGARIRILGKVTEYNGLTEITDAYGWYIMMDTVPQPKELGTSQFITEGMEGTLIQFNGVVKTTPYQSGDGYNFDVMNGDCGIAVRFTTSSGINPATIQKNEELVFIGIAGQYDPEEPYTTGYQLLLRFPTDFEYPLYDSASTVPFLEIIGNKTFIPHNGEQAEIVINSPLDYTLELTVHDMLGRPVKKLYSGAGGPQLIWWDGKDEYGNKCTIGIYLLNLKVRQPDGKSEFKRSLIVIGTES